MALKRCAAFVADCQTTSRGPYSIRAFSTSSSRSDDPPNNPISAIFETFGQSRSSRNRQPPAQTPTKPPPDRSPQTSATPSAASFLASTLSEQSQRSPAHTRGLNEADLQRAADRTGLERQMIRRWRVGD
ncbi:hypothetical protein LTR66_014236, partial [Elasticomyces elasticus]